MDALLTDQVVNAIGAVLATFILIAGAALAKLAKEKLDVDIDTSRLTAISAAAEQGVLLAAQQHRKAKEGAVVNGPHRMDEVNGYMHETAVKHVEAVARKAAKKAGRSVVNAAVHAAVRKLKVLL